MKAKNLLIFSTVALLLTIGIYSCSKEKEITPNPIGNSAQNSSTNTLRASGVEQVFMKDVENSDGTVNDIHIKVKQQSGAPLEVTVLNQNAPNSGSITNGILIDKSLTICFSENETNFCVPQGTYWLVSDNGDHVEKIANNDCYTVKCICLAGPQDCKVVNITTPTGIQAACQYDQCSQCKLQATKVGSGKKMPTFQVYKAEEIKVNGILYQ